MEIKIIDESIEKFFPMRKGEPIPDPAGMILFASGILISRKAVKHIVEQRSITDGFDVRAIKLLFRIACGVVADPQINVKNHNANYPDSRLLGSFDPEMNKGVIVVLENNVGGNKNVVTIFCKEARQFQKMQKNNP